MHLNVYLEYITRVLFILSYTTVSMSDEKLFNKTKKINYRKNKETKIAVNGHRSFRNSTKLNALKTLKGKYQLLRSTVNTSSLVILLHLHVERKTIILTPVFLV